MPQKQGQRIDRFVSFTHPFDIKPNRRFLYYFSVYVNLFKELFLLLLLPTCQVACFVKRVQRYREFPFQPNVLKIIFSRNELFYLKLTQIN